MLFDSRGELVELANPSLLAMECGGSCSTRNRRRVSPQAPTGLNCRDFPGCCAALLQDIPIRDRMGRDELVRQCKTGGGRQVSPNQGWKSRIEDHILYPQSSILEKYC